MKISELFEARGEYSSFKSWKAAVKKKHPDAWIEGDEDIAQAMVGPKPYKRGETKSVGEWDGAKGELFESQAARNAAEAGRGQSARDFKGKKTPYSGNGLSYWKDDAKEKGYTVKKVSGDLMKGDLTWHAFDGDKKVGEFTEKEEGRGGWLIEDGEQKRNETMYKREYEPVLKAHGFKKQPGGKFYKTTGCGLIEIDKHGHWSHTDVGEKDGGSEYEGTTARTLDRHLTSMGM